MVPRSLFEIVNPGQIWYVMEVVESPETNRLEQPATFSKSGKVTRYTDKPLMFLHEITGRLPGKDDNTG